MNKFFAIFLIIALVAFANEIIQPKGTNSTMMGCHPPTDVSVKMVLGNAEIQWKYDLPDTVISYNSGDPAAIWHLPQNVGLGVVFDLTEFPGATLEQIDFSHFTNGELIGPYYYNIHVYDMDSLKEVASLDSLIAQDALDCPEFEVGVELGSIPYIKNAGIFIEGLSSPDSTTNYYPYPLTDDSQLIPNTSYMCTNYDDPFNENDPNYTNIYEISITEPTATNVIIDMWINYSSSKTILISHHNTNRIENTIPCTWAKNTAITFDNYSVQPMKFSQMKNADNTLNLQNNTGFNIYRGPDVDNLEKIATVTSDIRSYLDEQALPDSTYFYAVTAFSDTLESQRVSVEYYHPKTLTISEAKVDNDGDFVPDLINQRVSISGVINSVNFGLNTQYYLQDDAAGICLYSGNFSVDLQLGDSVFISGTITQYKGLTEIEPDSVTDVTFLSSSSTIDTIKLNLSDIDELYECRLVSFDNVKIVDTGVWPGEGNDGFNVKVTDGVDTVDLLIDKETDLDGWTPPEGSIRLVGIVNQYTHNIPPGDGYNIRPRFRTDFEPLSSIEENNNILPAEYDLGQNYPNPFNPVTNINISVPKKSELSVDVYNVLGQKVAKIFEGELQAGVHKFYFNGSKLPSGVYFYKVQADDFTSVKKMILMK